MPKRRANGEGNIRKRKDGRWEGRYTAGYDPETGKRLIKNVLGKMQAEVKEKLKIAISESQRLDVSKAGNYTVASWVRTWYEVYAEPRIRPNTKAYYTNYIENHIIPGIGSIPLDKLTTIQIQRFYNNLQKSGRVQRKNFPELKDKSLSPRVVRGVHTLLHNCLEQAVAERLILSNPAQGCKLPQLEKREMKILPQEKIGMYLAEAERRGLLAAFYLELTTGLRRGELLALQWTDLDVENRTLAVTKQVNRITGEEFGKILFINYGCRYQWSRFFNFDAIFGRNQQLLDFTARIFQSAYDGMPAVNNQLVFRSVGAAFALLVKLFHDSMTFRKMSLCCFNSCSACSREHCLLHITQAVLTLFPAFIRYSSAFATEILQIAAIMRLPRSISLAQAGVTSII